MAKSRNNRGSRGDKTPKQNRKAKGVTAAVQAKVLKADALFREIIKRRVLLWGDRVECYTCDTTMHVKDSECGHFEKRADYGTRWLEENARVQCPRCNRELYGNIEVFEQRLEQELPGIVEHLKRLANTPVRLTSSYMDEVIQGLQRRLDEINGKERI
jgi:hypothetical protein